MHKAVCSKSCANMVNYLWLNMKYGIYSRIGEALYITKPNNVMLTMEMFNAP